MCIQVVMHHDSAIDSRSSTFPLTPLVREDMCAEFQQKSVQGEGDRTLLPKSLLNKKQAWKISSLLPLLGYHAGVWRATSSFMSTATGVELSSSVASIAAASQGGNRFNRSSASASRRASC